MAARKAASSARRVLRFQNEQRQTFVTFDKIAGVSAEQFREAIVAELVGLGQRQQLDEKAGELHDGIMRAPGVAVARADLKAEPAIKRGRRVKIAHGMNDVIEAAGHGRHFPFAWPEQTMPPFSVMDQLGRDVPAQPGILQYPGYQMTSKSRQGQRRDNHPLAPDAATKKAKKAERAAKGKYQAKLQGVLRRDAQDKMRRPMDD